MLLVINAGSSSIKTAVFDDHLQHRFAASVSEIGSTAMLHAGGQRAECIAPDIEAALRLCLDALATAGLSFDQLTGAAHRVVHGGTAFAQACRITPQVISAIEACVPLAPLHNPANLTAIRALADLFPNLPQYASFDTAFHATNPKVAVTYALPKEPRNLGIRRYGFHGISYAGIVRKVKEISENNLPRRLLALHLGNGASLCGIVDGLSVATSMGYSPLDGLTMGTRTGSIDGNAVLRMAEVYGIKEASTMLNRQSGLLGLGGCNDMRQLHDATTPEAAFAVEHFCYWGLRHAGSMIAAMGGLDAIAFSGGIGENDEKVRSAIVAGLAFAGAVPVWVIPAEEELTIAMEAHDVREAEREGRGAQNHPSS